MIVDAHCHAWAEWPYQPALPDRGRGAVERLLVEMDAAGVDRAVLIPASIGENPDNDAYVFAAAGQSGGRLIAFADADSRWQPSHQQPGAADRLHRLVARFRPAGVTHYMHEDADPGWLESPDGAAFLAAMEAHGLVLSLACGPAQVPAVARAAARVPRLPVLLHHLGRVRAGDAAALRPVLAAAACPNIHVKLSGLGYGVDDGWDYPLPAMQPVVRALHEAYGPQRLLWGSDWPVASRYMTYRQTLEIVRRHCPFLSDMPAILGGNMARLLS